ncbi:MAG: hypothetical protein KDD61_17230, partial [Bdellovibrionales bacterium]|nr:hypothetical protein [Bdellovibrionales bacterium]
KLTGILGKKVFSSYALKQQLSRRILFQLASHFPDELKVVYDVLNELNHLGRNRKYKEEMFSDKVIGRTKELMRGYPEMLKVLDVFH